MIRGAGRRCFLPALPVGDTNLLRKPAALPGGVGAELGPARSAEPASPGLGPLARALPAGGLRWGTQPACLAWAWAWGAQVLAGGPAESPPRPSSGSPTAAPPPTPGEFSGILGGSPGAQVLPGTAWDSGAPSPTFPPRGTPAPSWAGGCGLRG